MDYLIEMNGKKQAVLCVLLSVMIGTCMFMLSTSTVESVEDTNGYYVTLDISHYRDDVLLERQVIEDDYITRNFVYMWLNIFSGDRYADANADYRMTDIVNILRVPPTGYVYYDETTTRIRIGSGNTPVAITDYTIETPIASQFVDDVDIWYNGNEFNITADTTIVASGAYTIREAGVTIGYPDAGATARQTLMCRDVFSGISVVNGDVIILRYIFQFNVGL